MLRLIGFLVAVALVAVASAGAAVQSPLHQLVVKRPRCEDHVQERILAKLRVAHHEGCVLADPGFDPFDVEGAVALALQPVQREMRAGSEFDVEHGIGEMFVRAIVDELVDRLPETIGEGAHTVSREALKRAIADGKIVAIGPMRELLQSEHPWVRAYFHGKRSQMLQPKAS